MNCSIKTGSINELQLSNIIHLINQMEMKHFDYYSLFNLYQYCFHTISLIYTADLNKLIKLNT